MSDKIRWTLENRAICIAMRDAKTKELDDKWLSRMCWHECLNGYVRIDGDMSIDDCLNLAQYFVEMDDWDRATFDYCD